MERKYNLVFMTTSFLFHLLFLFFLSREARESRERDINEEKRRRKKPKVNARKALARKIPAMRTKKPKNAYVLFCKAKRPELLEKEPELKGKALQAKLNEIWKGFSEEEKAAYKAKPRTGGKKKAEEKKEEK